MSNTKISIDLYDKELDLLETKSRILESELCETISTSLRLIFQRYKEGSLILDPIERVDTYGDKETFISLDSENLLGINFLLTNSQFEMFRSIEGMRIVGVVFDKEGTPMFLKSPTEEKVSFPDFEVYGSELTLCDHINIAEGINEFMNRKGI